MWKVAKRLTLLFVLVTGLGYVVISWYLHVSFQGRDLFYPSYGEIDDSDLSERIPKNASQIRYRIKHFGKLKMAFFRIDEQLGGHVNGATRIDLERPVTLSVFDGNNVVIRSIKNGYKVEFAHGFTAYDLDEMAGYFIFDAEVNYPIPSP